MAKWADYLISGIWKTENGNSTYISHVMLHQDSETTIYKGIKTSRADVIKLLDSGKTVKTITWNYTSGSFRAGEFVGTVTVDNVRYLRSHQDGKVTDNLDNLIKMAFFI
jgi:hypothetical protein